MPEKWTGQLIGRMHNYKVTYDDLSKKMGLSKGYISQVLNCYRKPPNAQQRFESAVNEIIVERLEQSEKGE